MRPSYDAEHPHSATPIYDELYSEYRRLFRALPGDRSGEEDLKFTGFAVREGYPALTDQRSYPPQHQAFQTFAGQAVGIPQFMPSRSGVPDHTGRTDHPGHPGHTGHLGQQVHSNHSGHSGHAGHAGHSDHPSHSHDQAQAQTQTQGHLHSGHGTASTGHPGQPGHTSHPAHTTHATHTNHTPHPPAPYAPGFPPPPPSAQATQPSSAQGQFGTGQGWVAAGYLGAGQPQAPAHLPTPAHLSAPAPVTVPVPAPAPVVGTAFGPSGPGTSSGGRHRSLLSLPPGRSSEHH
ncbi:hypothetical protein ACFCX4_26730 [Kitasatospora sp. NPDC056327]|uniref:hypothetical protein n=1 Tax=Kitasatospora sp. NPDC056327 TaxID=3345785 RepID=UPI0035DD6D5C